jgi:hypothetical protein
MRLSRDKIFIINIMQAIAQPSPAALNGNFGLNRYKNCLRALTGRFVTRAEFATIYSPPSIASSRDQLSSINN